jgi:hypothetical protein
MHMTSDKAGVAAAVVGLWGMIMIILAEKRDRIQKQVAQHSRL